MKGNPPQGGVGENGTAIEGGYITIRCQDLFLAPSFVNPERFSHWGPCPQCPVVGSCLLWLTSPGHQLPMGPPLCSELIAGSSLQDPHLTTPPTCTGVPIGDEHTTYFRAIPPCPRPHSGATSARFWSLDVSREGPSSFHKSPKV